MSADRQKIEAYAAKINAFVDSLILEDDLKPVVHLYILLGSPSAFIGRQELQEKLVVLSWALLARRRERMKPL